MPTPNIKIAEPQDVDRLHDIWMASFKEDTHTWFKVHQGNSSWEDQLPRAVLESWIKINPEKGVFLKAVNSEGEIVGFSLWGFWNLKGGQRGSYVPSDIDDSVSHPDYPVDNALPLLTQLRNKTTAHMMTMQNRLCRAETRAVYCIAIAVDPLTQARGVGTTMIAHAARIADQYQAGMWVHLADSQKGKRAFEKNGFRLVSKNEVALDDYATKEAPGGEWGSYTFYCLARDPI